MDLSALHANYRAVQHQSSCCSWEPWCAWDCMPLLGAHGRSAVSVCFSKAIAAQMSHQHPALATTRHVSLMPLCRDAVKPWDRGSPVNLFGLVPEGTPRMLSNARRSRHVLVCAPSNSALDELLGRLLASGILNRCCWSSPAGAFLMSNLGCWRTRSASVQACC